MDKVLYSDQYLKITDKYLEIYYYYFPIGTSKIIQLSEIQKCGLAKEDFGYDSRLQYKSWGMGLANVWWSLDFGRALGWDSVVQKDHLVVESHDFRAGCTLKDRKVLDILKKQVPKSK